MKKLISISLVALLGLGLAACGESKGDRALSGAALGAGVGGVGSAVAGGSGTTGALIGAGVGAASGYLTDKDDVDLGKPVWR